MSDNGHNNGYLNLTIRSHLSNFSFNANVPGQMTAKNVKTNAIAELGQSLFTQTLDNTVSALRHVESRRRLQDDQTLAEQGVQDGDTLEVYEESAAGDSRSAPR